MNSKYFKAIPTFSSTNINVDKENGILKNTAIAVFGDNQNGSFFDDDFLKSLVTSGNQSEGGIKSRFGHPNMCATSFGTYIGRYRNFSYRENGTGGNMTVFADLHLDPITRQTEVEGKGIKMFDYIMHMAETNPDMFGNSIHIFSQTYEKPVDGKVKQMHLLEKFKACDLVDDPAATDSLFSANPNDLGIIVTQFLDDNPSIFEVISKQPNILENFFERYFNYAERKSLNTFNMSKSDFFKNLFGTNNGKKFDKEVTLADGSIVTVKTDAEQPQVGDEVVDDTGKPVEDKEHLLPDGGAIVTVGGKITEIKDKVETPPVEGEEPTMAEVMQSINNLGKQFKAFQTSIEKSISETDESLKTVATEVKNFQEQTNTKLKGITSKYDVPPGEQGGDGGAGANAKGYDADKAREFREKNKK